MLPMVRTTHLNEWMSEIVVVEKDCTLLAGYYDGYGRVSGLEFEVDPDNEKDEPACYHAACYKLMGSPIRHEGPSTAAKDQGFFFDDDVYENEEPQTVEEMLALIPAEPNVRGTAPHVAPEDNDPRTQMERIQSVLDKIAEEDGIVEMSSIYARYHREDPEENFVTDLIGDELFSGTEEECKQYMKELRNG